MKYHLILVSSALGLLLISLALPWLVVNLFGQTSYSALDSMGFLANFQGNPDTAGDNIVISDLRSVYPDSSWTFILSIAILYPIAILGMIAAVILAAFSWKRNRRTSIASVVALAAGIFAIVSGIVWIYSIESFKTQFSRDADLAGGLIGEEWKGNAGVFVDRLVVLGVGHYLVIAAGVIAVFSYFGVTSTKQETQMRPPTKAEG